MNSTHDAHGGVDFNANNDVVVVVVVDDDDGVDVPPLPIPPILL
jgi:hypothetical protein